MRIIQKLLFTVTGILGASFGVLTMLLANRGFHMHLSTPGAFFCGLAGGLLLGWMIAVYVSMMVMKYIRRKLATGFGGVLSMVSSLFRDKRS
jgi:fluoride ion exporter CrcB/FEX